MKYYSTNKQAPEATLEMCIRDSHIAVADIDRCLGQFIYSVEHIVFLVVLKNATGFTYDP